MSKSNEMHSLLELFTNSKTIVSTTLPSSQYWCYKAEKYFPEEWKK